MSDGRNEKFVFGIAVVVRANEYSPHNFNPETIARPAIRMRTRMNRKIQLNAMCIRPSVTPRIFLQSQRCHKYTYTVKRAGYSL